jgi:hypothetical protein
MTCMKLAALNHGTIRSRIPNREHQVVADKLRKWALPQNLWVRKRDTGSAQARQEGLPSHLHLRSAPVN